MDFKEPAFIEISAKNKFLKTIDNINYYGKINARGIL